MINLSSMFGMKPKDAADYFKKKGYKFSWHWYDTWQDAHAKAFTVAKAMKMDLLSDIRDSVNKAIENGVTYSEFAKELEPKLRAKGWWGRKIDREGKPYWAGTPSRMKLIYNQNLHTAYSAGRYKSMSATVKQRPYWQYVAVLDSRTRPAHLALAGEIVRADDPFWQSYYPPNGWNCRCSVRSLAPGDIGTAGFNVKEADDGQITVKPTKGEVASPNISWEQKTVGGQSVSVPHGIDPGWAYNPGRAAWQPDLDRYSYAMAKQYLEGAVTGPDFTRFFEGKVKGNFPVAAINQKLKSAIGSISQVVYLTDETLSMHLKKHPELGLADFQKLPDIIDKAQLIVLASDKTFVFYRYGQKTYYGSIENTANGKINFLTSLKLASQSDIEAIRKKGKIIKDD